MENYFDDITFRIVAHRFKISGPESFSTSESNSLEFIRSGELRLEYADGLRVPLKAPAFFWIPRGREFRFSLPPGTPPGRASEHIYADILGPRSERMMAALDALFPEKFFTPRDPERVSALFFELLRLYRSSPERNHPEMAALAERLMALACSNSDGKEIPDPYGLDRIAEDLRSDPFADFDFSRLARKAGLSPDHFRRLFRKRHQLTPHAYLNHQRMFRAAELLRTTGMRIKEIVFSCRFTSGVEFSRGFKKFSGLSPRAYREQCRRGGAFR